MSNVVIEFSPQELQLVESILMDDDADEALRFIRKVIKTKLRGKTNPALDTGRSTGIMT
ncbi:MAG: hypothetical protein SV487_08340 [Thermodesulfobacteriota bacterium]|nr:hypothetical protein [Thermodesulfobacteriota bacterium]